MHAGSDNFLQEISERISKLREFSDIKEIDDLATIANEISEKLNKLESPSKLPAPEDPESSFLSFSSSISVPDVSVVDQVNLIKDKNKELRKTATLTLQDFKNVSRNLLSKSQIQSGKGSLILNEMDIVKIDEESKIYVDANKSFSPEKLRNFEIDDGISAVYTKIYEIQKEISEASQRLIESESLISSTEKKNNVLEKRKKMVVGIPKLLNNYLYAPFFYAYFRPNVSTAPLSLH